MKIIILGKKNQVGTVPAINVKGMSQVRYNFIWDREVKYYAYTPKNQKEVDDIFRTQGRLYKHMHFSVLLEIEAEEEHPIPKAKDRKKAKAQPVEEDVK
jgi:hypothetical protein